MVVAHRRFIFVW